MVSKGVLSPENTITSYGKKPDRKSQYSETFRKWKGETYLILGKPQSVTFPRAQRKNRQVLLIFSCMCPLNLLSVDYNLWCHLLIMFPQSSTISYFSRYLEYKYKWRNPLEMYFSFKIIFSKASRKTFLQELIAYFLFTTYYVFYKTWT
jgi:hypothetical protein